MLKEIKHVIFKLEDKPKAFSKYQNEISKCWKDYSRDRKDDFDGEVIAVTNISSKEDIYDITISVIKYSELIYSKMIKEIKIKALFSGGYIITRDNYICFALNKKNVINLVGGLASSEDIVNSTYDSSLCMLREFKEELGLNLNDNKFRYSIKYIKYSTEEDIKKNHSIGLIYEIKTDYTKDELNNLFISMNHDNELKELIFLRKNEISKLNEYDKVVYIDELYSLIKGE